MPPAFRRRAAQAQRYLRGEGGAARMGAAAAVAHLALHRDRHPQAQHMPGIHRHRLPGAVPAGTHAAQRQWPLEATRQAAHLQRHAASPLPLPSRGQHSGQQEGMGRPLRAGLRTGRGTGLRHTAVVAATFTRRTGWMRRLRAGPGDASSASAGKIGVHHAIMPPMIGRFQPMRGGRRREEGTKKSGRSRFLMGIAD